MGKSNESFWLKSAVLLLLALLVTSIVICIVFSLQLKGMREEISSLEWDVAHLKLPEAVTDSGTGSLLPAILDNVDFASLNNAVATVSAAAEKLNAADLSALNPEELDRLIESFNTAAEKLNQIDTDKLNSAVFSLQTAGDNISKLDITAINKAVSALTSAAEQFRSLDVEKMNEVIANLKTVTEKLESISSFFGR